MSTALDEYVTKTQPAKSSRSCPLWVTEEDES